MKTKSHNVKLTKYVFLSLIFTFVYLTGCTKHVIQHQKIIEAPSSAFGKTVFFDDFSPASQLSTRNMWLSNGKSHWIWQGKTSSSPGCIDGCLKQNNEADRDLNTIMYVSTPQITSAIIETKTRINYDMSIAITSEELKNLRYFIGNGIVFRLVDHNNYYMFRLAGEEGCVLGKMVNNKWIDLANPRRLDFLEGGRIKPNQWYTLKVKVFGNIIECSINDSPVISVSDPDDSFPVGHFGLATFKSFADFEYINVTTY